MQMMQRQYGGGGGGNGGNQYGGAQTQGTKGMKGAYTRENPHITYAESQNREYQ